MTAYVWRGDPSLSIARELEEKRTRAERISASVKRVRAAERRVVADALLEIVRSLATRSTFAYAEQALEQHRATRHRTTCPTCGALIRAAAPCDVCPIITAHPAR